MPIFVLIRIFGRYHIYFKWEQEGYFMIVQTRNAYRNSLKVGNVLNINSVGGSIKMFRELFNKKISTKPNGCEVIYVGWKHQTKMIFWEKSLF